MLDALRARVRKAAWKASSASCSWRSTRRQVSLPMGPCRLATAGSKADWSPCSTHSPSRAESPAISCRGATSCRTARTQRASSVLMMSGPPRRVVCKVRGGQGRVIFLISSPSVWHRLSSLAMGILVVSAWLGGSLPRRRSKELHEDPCPRQAHPGTLIGSLVKGGQGGLQGLRKPPDDARGRAFFRKSWRITRMTRRARTMPTGCWTSQTR